MSTRSADEKTQLLSSLDLVKQVLETEANAIEKLSRQLDDAVVKTVSLLLECKGKVIVTGMGKMGWIGRKAAATFSSTGTPSIFLHPGEAAHGDLGVVTRDDIVLALSKSGETTEVVQLIPYLQRINVPIIAVTGNPGSSLAARSSLSIDIGVAEEADTIADAPTTSTTVTLALCDAIAIALMHRRGFTKDQFAIFHPGGHLGRKMLLTVRDTMHAGERMPLARAEDPIRVAIVTISRGGLGAALIVDSNDLVLGILTDGDLRRTFEATENPLADLVSQHMTVDPISVSATALAAEALRIMEDHEITVLPVTDPDGRAVGIIHLHDLIRAGLA